jgi:hypothetical protein
MTNIDPATLRLRKNQCKTCPFRRENQNILHPKRWAEIYSYLLQGTQHVCHSTNRHVCRGARDWQLNVWYSTGIIDEPTDASLHEAMTEAGQPPKAKDYDSI